MNGARPDAAGRLWWAVRRWWWMLVLIVAAFTAGGLLLGGDDDPAEAVYEARALIAAADLGIRPEQFARTTSTIFRTGDVAHETAAVLGLAGDPDDLIPAVIDFEAVEDTVLLGVLGRAADPVAAAAIANEASAAYLRELNSLGVGFGRFVAVSDARPPDEPLPRAAGGGGVVLAVIAGILFGIGSIGLVLSLRRPVMTPWEAAEMAGTAVIGAVDLPSGIDPPPTTTVPGLSAMTRLVLPDGRGTAVFVSLRGDSGQRSQVALLFARAMSRRLPVSLLCAADAPLRDDQPNLVVSRIVDKAGLDPDKATVVDGLTAHGTDVPSFLPASSRVVLVVWEGVPADRLARAARQFLDDELAGLVFVSRERRSVRRSTRPAETSPSAVA